MNNIGNHNGPLLNLAVLSDTAPRISGGTLQLAGGQLGLARAHKGTANGKELVADFSGFGPKEKFQLVVGSGRETTDGGTTNKPMTSVMFTKDDVLDVSFETAKDYTLHEVTLGYNGVSGTGMSLKKGEATVISLTLTGEILSLYGFDQGRYTAQFPVIGSDLENDDCACDDPCVAITCKNVATTLVDRIKSYRLRTGALNGYGGEITIGDLIEVIPTFDCNVLPTPSATWTYYTLTVQDSGRQVDLERVQAQYPDYSIVRSEPYEDTTSVYQLLKPTGIPTAYQPYTEDEPLFNCTCPTGYTETGGGFVYEIIHHDNGVSEAATMLDAILGVSHDTGSVYTFDNLGAADASRTPGTYTAVASTASGAGTGATFTVVVGVGGAVTSLTPVNQGSGYVVGETITIADSVLGGGGAANFTFDVASLATKADSVNLLSNDNGNGRYLAVFPTKLDATQLAALRALDESAEVTYKGNMDSVCVPNSQPSTIAWVAGESCNVATQDYFIDLKDTECSVSRLADLQAAYPDLTITEDADAGLDHCRRRFVTTITSINQVCDDCEEGEYNFEAPEAFETKQWARVPEAAGALTSFSYALGGSFGVTGSTTSNVATGSITTSGSGTGAAFQVITNAAGDGISKLTMTAKGSGYAVGDTITIPGTALTGGSSTADDITLTIRSVGGEYPDDCECGIKFKSRMDFLCNKPELMDRIKTLTPQGVQIEVSGGEAPANQLIGYNFVSSPFTVTDDVRPFNGTGWGVNFINMERISHVRNLGISSCNYAESVLQGLETRLQPCKQYDTATVLIRGRRYSGAMGEETEKDIRYMFVMEQGTIQRYAALFNALGGNIEDYA
jgi:hypothetical protein